MRSFDPLVTFSQFDAGLCSDNVKELRYTLQNNVDLGNAKWVIA